MTSSELQEVQRHKHGEQTLDNASSGHVLRPGIDYWGNTAKVALLLLPIPIPTLIGWVVIAGISGRHDYGLSYGVTRSTRIGRAARAVTS